MWCYDHAPSLGDQAQDMYAPRSATGDPRRHTENCCSRRLGYSIDWVGRRNIQGSSEGVRDASGRSGYRDLSPGDDKSRLHLWHEQAVATPVANQTAFRSLTWLRPVILSVAINEQARIDLLHANGPRMECIFPDCERARGTHKVETKTNILRGAIGLSMASDSFSMGWQERITVYKPKPFHRNAGPCPTRRFFDDNRQERDQLESVRFPANGKVRVRRLRSKIGRGLTLCDI